ncbi:MAG: hypothetical protein LBG97_06670 [Coriobacteriales bacterium]|nr:hypothetical protein [Coriobacteriales bacterium]
MEANKVLLEERLKIDSYTASDAAYIFNKYGIGRITDMKIESENKDNIFFVVTDESNDVYYIAFNKWSGLSRIHENDRYGKMIYGAINVMPLEIFEENAKVAEEAEKRSQAAKDARNNTSTSEQDTSIAGNVDVDDSATDGN